MSTVLTAKKESTEIKTMGHKETSGGDADVCYFDLRDGLRVCTEVQTHQMVYINFLYINYTLTKLLKSTSFVSEGHRQQRQVLPTARAIRG